MKKYFTITLLVILCLKSFTQNVGIGISDPVRAKLEVQGAVGSTNALFGGETTGISLQSNLPGIGFNQYQNNGYKYISDGYAAVQFFDPANGSMALDILGYGAANTAPLTSQRVFNIANNGNIGIRTAPTNASLYVIRGTNIDGSAVFGGTAYNSHFNYGAEENTFIRAGKNNGTVFLNDIVGGRVALGGGASNVGINTGNPAYTLEVRQNGTGLLLVDPTWFFNNWELKSAQWLGDDNTLILKYNGILRGQFVPDNGEYANFSDRRLKINIREMPSLLDKIMQLRPVTYQSKEGSAKQKNSVGFIAQDVKPLFPELVYIGPGKGNGYDDIADLHMMNYSGFGVLAIKAIQEQQKEIEILKNEISELKKMILSKP